MPIHRQTLSVISRGPVAEKSHVDVRGFASTSQKTCAIDAQPPRLFPRDLKLLGDDNLADARPRTKFLRPQVGLETTTLRLTAPEFRFSRRGASSLISMPFPSS